MDHQCARCETADTVYEVKLSVIVTLAGAPECHTKAAIVENVIAWLETLIEQAAVEEAIDSMSVIEVQEDKL